MKSDHEKLVEENQKLVEQVEKGNQAVDTKQTEENELRAELDVMNRKVTEKIAEVKSLEVDTDQIEKKLRQASSMMNPNIQVAEFEETVEYEKTVLLAKRKDLEMAQKAYSQAKKNKEDFDMKIEATKQSLEQEAKKTDALRAELAHKRTVYNNQQQRKESFCLVSGKLKLICDEFESHKFHSGSLEAKKEELKGLERKISETRAQLDAKMVENEKVLAEISISANGQVNQANEKESHLLSEIASFLGTTVEAVAEEDFGKFFYSESGLYKLLASLLEKCQNHFAYVEADHVTTENTLRRLEDERTQLLDKSEKMAHLESEDVNELRRKVSVANQNQQAESTTEISPKPILRKG